MSPIQAADAPEARVIQEANHVSTGSQVQQFSTNIVLPDADKTKPLTLTFINGPEADHKFAWVRVFLGDRASGTTGGAKAAVSTGRMLINEASLKRSNQVDVNLTGLLKNTSTLMISGAGYKGATVSWKLTTPGAAGASTAAAPASAPAAATNAAASTAKGATPAAAATPAASTAKPAAAAGAGPSITTVSPPIARGSGILEINGAGFSPTAGENVVFFNQTRVAVSKATPTKLAVTVPSSLAPGRYELGVTAKGVKAQPIAITVAGAPHLSHLDVSAGPCGCKVTIFGKNFSETAADNIVFFNKSQATVDAATATSLSVTVPQFPELDGFTSYAQPTNIDVSVSVGSTPAQEHLTFVSAGTKISE